MTEKRFDFKYDGVGYSYYLCDKEEGASYEDRVFAEIWADKSEVEDIVNKMNALHEENQSFEIHSKWQGEKYSELLDSFTNMKKKLQLVKKENEQLRKENEKLESLWEDKCIKEYMKIVGENALQEMHNEKYGDK